ncbi:MAG TPA: VanZ family protein, partial [Gammaproteobacteria bacterium]|nr:VanZ family protein [Gammaproteobacteria bacterium]
MADNGAGARRLRSGWQALGFGMVVLVWWACLVPSPPEIPPAFPYFDKFEHFIAYLVLAGWFAAIHARMRARIVVLCLLVLMGGVIEVLQHYTGRDAEWLDWLA